MVPRGEGASPPFPRNPGCPMKVLVLNSGSWQVLAAGRDDQGLEDLLTRRSTMPRLCGVKDIREIHRHIGPGDTTPAMALEVSSATGCANISAPTG